MQNIYIDLIAVLKEKKMEYFDNEGNTLKQKIASDGLNLKPELIKVILQNEKLKEHFTVDVDGITVFDKVKFQRFVNNKMYLEESYTQFLNKMGLADANGELLSKKNDVVLVWPYKDCVLQGGQTKEDDKRMKFSIMKFLLLMI
jgi:adenine-specific DNA-methyltransferase